MSIEVRIPTILRTYTGGESEVPASGATLGEVLDEVSVYYSKVLRDSIKAVTSMIEPLMIVVMGSIVGFIAMAIILPIFKMSNLVAG